MRSEFFWTPLAHQHAGDMYPPRSGVEVSLHAKDLEQDKQGKSVEIHLVYPAIDDEVTQNAEKDQSVYARRREGVR